MVYIVFLSTFVILVSNVFFSFDEESIIIFASVLWVDAAGGLFKKFFDAELVHKSTATRDKFVGFLSLKRSLALELLQYHRTRKHLAVVVSELNNYFLFATTSVLVGNFLQSVRSRRLYTARLIVTTIGAAVHFERLARNLETSMAIVHFSGTDVRSLNRNTGVQILSYSNLQQLII